MLNNGDSHAQPAPAALHLAEESFARFWPDARGLLERHYREISAHPDIPLSVDVEAYREGEAKGRLCIITARVEGALVGYCVFFVGLHPHYATSLQAQEDVLYLDPAYRRRGLGAELLQFSERLLIEKGVQLVHHHSKVAHPALGALLAQHGYAMVEHIYSKRLDRTEV